MESQHIRRLEAKTVEDVEKPDSKESALGNKVPGTSVGTRAIAALGPVPAGSAAGFLGESQVNGSLPCQTRFEQHQDGPECLKLLG